MSDRAVELFRTRHQDVQRSEKAGPVRFLLRLARILEPERSDGARSVYTYMRVLDDVVDESDYIQLVRALLDKERRGLRGFQEPTPLQEEYVTPHLVELFGERAVAVRDHLDKIIQSLEIDANIRYTQQPPTDIELRRRSLLVVHSVFSILTLGKFGIEPKVTPAIKQTWHDLVAYDNVSDIFEDLPHGLVLITQEDLTRHNLEFTDGKLLPVDKLMAYNQAKRREIRWRLHSSSKAAFDIGVPSWFAGVLFMYLYSRSLKMFIPPKEKHGLVYRAPLDSLGRTNH